jgi:transcription antitermination factor NusG
MSSMIAMREHFDASSLPDNYLQPLWYATYTRANHEKRVQEQLEQSSVESFLPLYEECRRWKDRKMRLQLPLFPGYVFVHLALRDRLRVLQIPGVVRLVGFNGDPVPLTESDIEALRTALDGRSILQPHPYLTVGRRVRIKDGPLKGMEGVLIRKKNIFRLVVSISLIARSASVEIDTANVERIN